MAAVRAAETEQLTENRRLGNRAATTSYRASETEDQRGRCLLGISKRNVGARIREIQKDRLRILEAQLERN